MADVAEPHLHATKRRSFAARFAQSAGWARKSCSAKDTVEHDLLTGTVNRCRVVRKCQVRNAAAYNGQDAHDQRRQAPSS